MVKVQGLDRVVVYVKDLNQEIRFWEDLLETEFNAVEVAQPDGSRNLAALSPVGLELIQVLNPPSKLQGIQSFLLKVKDLDAAVEGMRRKGHQPAAFIEVDSLREALYFVRGVSFLFAEYRGRNYGLKRRVKKLS